MRRIRSTGGLSAPFVLFGSGLLGIIALAQRVWALRRTVPRTRRPTAASLWALAKPSEPVPLRKNLPPQKPMTRGEAQQVWDDLVREERYQSMAFLNADSQGVTESGLHARGGIIEDDRRAGYLGEMFGFLQGGGSRIEGRLVAEMPIEGRLWQLYANRVTEWSPSLGEWVASLYQNASSWQFQLLSRDPMKRSAVMEVKSFIRPPKAVPPGVTPKGLLCYDVVNHTVSIVISGGLAKPLFLQIPIVPLVSTLSGRAA